MARSSKKHIVIPSAKRLMASLRDTGYDFSQAIADIVDNSIEARASQVNIDIEFQGDDSWVRIADNGHGMSAKTIREAMRYGSDSEYDDDSLGKFGLGLKTASLSQCRRLTVASRKSLSSPAAFCWDLDHVAKTDLWEILPIEPGKLVKAIIEPLLTGRGTVVFWQRLDRILGYKLPYGDAAKQRLSSMCAELEAHLAMVFHRFLSGDVPRRKFTIILNGNIIKPWDPYCRDEPGTKLLHKMRFPVDVDGASVGEVIVKPYILPTETDFSSPDAFRRASGPAKWNQQQGLYIYRSNRMIQCGGWAKLRAADEHTKYARVAVDYTKELDDYFKINFPKTRGQLPSQIREELREQMSKVAKLARKVYDKKTDSSIPISAPIVSIGSASSNIQKNISHNTSSSSMAPTYNVKQWAEKMRSVSRPAELPVVNNILLRLI